MKKEGLKYYIFLLLATILGACAQAEIPVPPELPSEEIVTTNFVVNFSQRPSTYALDATKETEVKEVNLFVFEQQTDYSEKLAQHVSTQTLTDKGSGKWSFSVELKKSKNNHRFVVIANARTEATPLGGATYIGEEKGALMAQLISNSTGPWPVESSYKPIPMWGESLGMYVLDEGLSAKNIEIALFRSLARVDITNGATNFDMKEIYIYRQNQSGRVAPVKDAAHWNETLQRFVMPSLPSGAISRADVSYTTAIASGAQELKQNIYLYETTIPTNADPSAATCLVIGGDYQGSMRYYRVDFFDEYPFVDENGGNNNSWEQGPPSSDSGDGDAVGGGLPFSPILRNHHYEVKIATVTGNGYTNANDAASNRSSKLMVYEYVDWDDQRMNVTIGGNTYTLEIEKTKVVLGNGVTSDQIKVTTNYPSWGVSANAYTWFNAQISQTNASIIEVAVAGTPTANKIGSFKLLFKEGNVIKFEKQIQVIYYH